MEGLVAYEYPPAATMVASSRYVYTNCSGMMSPSGPNSVFPGSSNNGAMQQYLSHSNFRQSSRMDGAYLPTSCHTTTPVSRTASAAD